MGLRWLLVLGMLPLTGCMTTGLVRSTFHDGTRPGEPVRAVALSGAAEFPETSGQLGLPQGEGLLLRLVFEDGSFATAALPLDSGGVVLAEDHPAASLPGSGPALEPGRWLEVGPWLVRLDLETDTLLRRASQGPAIALPLPRKAHFEEAGGFIYWLRIGFFPIVLPLTVCFDAVTLPIQGVYAATSEQGMDALLAPSGPPPQLP